MALALHATPESSAPISAEEADTLKRSRKKVRTDGSFSKDQTLVPRVEDWMVEDTLTDERGAPREKPQWNYGRRTFRDALNNSYGEEEEEDEWWKEEEWQGRCKVEMTDKGPNVIFSAAEKERLAGKWRKSLIVSLLGRMISFDYLERKIRQFWERYGEIEVIDVSSGFYVIRFSDHHDYELALTGGPWLILDHYLSVQPWKQDFNPETEIIHKVSAWIRVDKLPLDYYDKGALFVIGSQVGRVLKVDVNTEKHKKGRFARICVEVDLSSPLCSMVLVNGVEYKIQYESMYTICMTCGKYGHLKHACLLNRRKNTEASENTNGSKREAKSSEGGGNIHVAETSLKLPEEEVPMAIPVQPTNITTGRAEEEEATWMVVRRKRRPQRPRPVPAASRERQLRGNNDDNLIQRGSRAMAGRNAEKIAAKTSQVTAPKTSRMWNKEGSVSATTNELYQARSTPINMAEKAESKPNERVSREEGTKAAGTGSDLLPRRRYDVEYSNPIGEEDGGQTGPIKPNVENMNDMTWEAQNVDVAAMEVDRMGQDCVPLEPNGDGALGQTINSRPRVNEDHQC